MVIDTSALAAILFREPERRQFLEALLADAQRLVSVATMLETGIVVEGRKGEAAGREFDLFAIRAGLEVVPFDAEQLEIARSAWRKYGKGRHPAGLNFGDCVSYALAKFTGQPLLAKGTEFASTDVVMHS